MMSTLQAAMLAVSSSPAASVVAKATLALALGLAAALLARRSPAALRHLLLAATFGVLLLLPLATLLAPPLRIAVATAPATLIQPAHTTLTLSDTPTSPITPPAIPTAPRPSLPALLLAAWIIGAALCLLPVAIGLWQVRRLRRTALPWPQGQTLAGQLTREGRIRRVEVLLHVSLPGPMTCGVLRPAIVLPFDATTWSPDALDRALIHELEHIRRADRVTHCVARAVCAAYWFHPLAWIAWRQLTLHAERSCDDAVLRCADPTAYADQLVDLAQRLSATAKSPLLAMANRTHLADRVGAVLNLRQRRGRAGAATVAVVSLTAAALLLTLSPLAVVAAPPPVVAAVASVEAATAPQPAPAPPKPQPATPQPEVASTIRFTTNTYLVITNVVVTEERGRTITNLNANDFVLTEDGVPQNIAFCDFHRMLSQPEDNLPSYYTLGYYAIPGPSNASFKKIQVSLPTLKALAHIEQRQGYWVTLIPSEKVSVMSPIAPDFQPPMPVYKPEAAYSEEARDAKYQGTVTLSLDIDASGKPVNIRVARSLGLGLDEEAVKAVSQWRFKPATGNGNPIRVSAQVDVKFQLL